MQRKQLKDRRRKITQAFVDSLPLCQTGQRYIYDTDLSGFGICVGRTTKSYFAERRPDRACMTAILHVARGAPWRDLDRHGDLCPSSTAHGRCMEWKTAGVFDALRGRVLAEHAELSDVDWDYLCSE